MASVLLPEPPFWVASTIVCISSPLDSFQRSFGYALQEARILRRRGLSPPRRSQSDPKEEIADVRITHLAIMQDCGILAIPGEHGRARISPADARKRQQEAGQDMTGHWRDRATTVFTCQKQPATGSRGMVVSNHPLASSAGAEMLAAGGNASDAAIATLFTRTVVEPMMVGIIGGGMAHIRTSDGSHRFIDGQSTVPLAGRPQTHTPNPRCAHQRA